MSSSPFELFRRNLKPMMVFLTLLALLSFVVLPSVAMYQQQKIGYGAAESKLATYQGVDFDFTKVNFFTRNHFATTQFLNDLAETTIARGGVPKVADFQYDTQQKMIRSLGINSNPSDEASVRTMMFANEAKKIGLDLDDTAIRNWLTLYTDGRLSDAEINGVLATSSRNQIGQVQLYEQLRTQLLAQAYQRQVMGGITASGMPIVPPAQQWELFLRLNRRAVADAYAVNVADFISKTSEKPSEKQILDTYEDGKSRYPDDQSAKPAFRRPYTASIEYVAGNLNDFVDREKATLTEEQLRAEYQKRLEGGDFKLPETPAADTPAAVAPTEGATPPVTSGPTTPAPTENPAVSEEPMEPAAEEQTAAPQSPALDAPATEAPATEAPAAETPAPESPPASGSSERRRDQAVRLVTMQQGDEPVGSEPAVDATKNDATETPAAAAEAPPAAAETPAADAATQDAPADTETKTDTPAAVAETAADAPGATTEEMKSTPENPVAPEPPKVEEPKVEPFEKVRDDIARSLAEPPALAKLDAAVTEVDKVMRSYFNAVAIAGKDASKKPKAPDLKALAEKLGMKHVSKGALDAREIQDDPVSLSFGVGTGMQRGESLTQMLYVARTPLFTPVRTVDDQAQISYISWKTEEKKAYIPELKEARDEVVTAIRTAEARKLADAEAKRLAKEFASSDKPIRELIPAERSSMYFESLGPFSWMTSFGFNMRAFMGNVPELDRVGEAFMRQVFTSERGQWGVAANMPETVYYVVRPTEFSPSTDELHQRFTQLTQRMQTTSLAVEEAIKIRDGHYESLDKKVGFEWNEEALNRD